VHPVSATYIALYRGVASETSANLSAVQNLAGGNDGGSSAFAAARPGSDPSYFLWRYGFSHLQAFANDWQARFAFNGQITGNKLIAGEQFGIGGVDSVRGFFEREVTADTGFRGTTELYTPDFASSVPMMPGGSRLRSVFFYDWGVVKRRQPLLAEQQQSSIASFGLGMRYSRGTNTSLRLDYAVVTDPGGTQGKNDGRLHASFAYIF
jgi:hemolysin activation/secretion protein